MNIRQMLEELGMSDPYSGINPSDLPQDLQGWSSEHPYFASLVASVKPRQIIEVGTWKGASALAMARHALTFNKDITMLCVDTWLGSTEMWAEPELRPLLKREFGHPSVYRQFLHNMIHHGFTKIIYPFPLSSLSAAELLLKFEIQAELIYLDGGHSELEVYADIVRYWPLVASGGILFGDDYYEETWDGVVRAVNRFVYEEGLALETISGKWFVRKLANRNIRRR